VRAKWIVVVLAAGLAGGLLAGELVYRWAAVDFERVRQISFMLASVDSVAAGQRLVEESERLRPAWRWPGSQEVHFWLARGDYLAAGAAAGALAGGLAVVVLWGLARRRKKPRGPGKEGAPWGSPS